MKPKDFKRWRKSLGLSQKDAAEALGLKRRVVQYYEKGERDGKDVGIPKAVRLACYALTEGVSDYHGPRDSAETPSRPLTNGAGHDGEHVLSAAPEIVTLRSPEDGKKSKRRKEKEKDKGREKGKGKSRDRGKGETVAAPEKPH
jgi:transcriptional regulator with XRE-family HTH domain